LKRRNFAESTIRTYIRTVEQFQPVFPPHSLWKGPLCGGAMHVIARLSASSRAGREGSSPL
jgi:hypothetical protein